MSATPRWEQHAREELRRAGAQRGAAREAVIDRLAAQRCCMTAQELFDQIRNDGRTIGIASVYRALEGLVDAHLVHRVDLGDGVMRFEPAHPGGEHHHHLVCDSCGAVDTFDDDKLEHALGRVAQAREFVLLAHDVVLHGNCRRCAA